MKKLILVTFSILFTLSICLGQVASIELQDFAQDLSTANVKLKGDLILSDKYYNNLTSLNYDAYLVALKKSEMKSNKGITKTLTKAENHYFLSSVRTFHVVVYCKKYNAIIVDDAGTPFIDSVKVINKNEKIPDLKGFVHW